MPTTHNADIDVFTMVLDRLPFLANVQDNVDRASRFTFEVMSELEPCFKVSILSDGTQDLSRVGDEANYTFVQKSIVADIVSVYILLRAAVGMTSGVNDTINSLDGTATGKILTEAKAGSVEVKYAQFNMKEGVTLASTGANLMAYYKKQAMRKAHNVGCIIDICDDCTIVIESVMRIPVPFMVVTSGCTNCGS